MSVLGDIFGGITGLDVPGTSDLADLLLGEGKTTVESKVTLDPATQQELDVRQSLLDRIDELFATSPGFDEALSAQFRNLLVDFASRDEVGRLTPEGIAEATSFVDRTFTQPAAQVLAESRRQFTAQQEARAAQLGRQPTDTGFQQQLAQEFTRGGVELGAQRGQRIQDLTLKLPALRQEAAFQRIAGLSDINERAQRNRLSLLNQQTGFLSQLQQERFKGAGSTQVTQAPSAGLLGDVAGISASLAGLGSFFQSDFALKKNIEDAHDEVNEFLDNIKPIKFKFKDEKYGHGSIVGILAQDLEKSSMGKSMVDDTPQGKVVDISKAVSGLLAAVTELNQRLRRLEKQNGK